MIAFLFIDCPRGVLSANFSDEAKNEVAAVNDCHLTDTSLSDWRRGKHAPLSILYNGLENDCAGLLAGAGSGCR